MLLSILISSKDFMGYKLENLANGTVWTETIRLLLQ